MQPRHIFARYFDAATLVRGERYANQGKVVSLVQEGDDGPWLARVKGSARNAYQVRFRASFTPTGGCAAVSGECTCPVQYACKHLVAALWVLRQSPTHFPRALVNTVAGGARTAPERPAPAPAPTPAPVLQESGDALPPQIELWLQRLAQASAPAPIGGRGPASRDRIVFGVYPLGTSSLRLALFKVKLQPDGTCGLTGEVYPDERLRGKTVPKFVSREDLEILDAAESLDVIVSHRDYGGYVHVSARRRLLPDAALDWLPLLRRLVATGRARWRGVDGPTLHEGPPRALAATWRESQEGTQRLELCDAQSGAPLTALRADPPVWIDAQRGAFGPVEGGLAPELLALALAAPEIEGHLAARVAERVLGLGNVGNVGNPESPGHRARAATLPPPRSLAVERRQGVVPQPVLRLFGLPGTFHYGDWSWAPRTTSRTFPALELRFDYDGHMTDAVDARPLRAATPTGVVVIERDLAAERRARAELGTPALTPLDGHERYRFDASGAGARWFIPTLACEPRGAEPAERPAEAFAFLQHQVPRLRAAGWRVDVDESWPCPLVLTAGAITASLGATGEGLFDFGLTLRVDGHAIELVPLITALLQALPRDAEDAFLESDAFTALVRERACYVPLPDGRVAAIDSAIVIELARAFARHLGLFARVHPAEAGEMKALADALEGCGVPFEGGAELLALGRKLRDLQSTAVEPPPAALRAQLRPYQALGYAWLKALSETGFGGLLADDMGLGKTLQALALLVQRHLVEQSGRPSLLVVPTSLARTWANQAAQFAPELRVLVLQGADRQARFDEIEGAHVVVTTYPLLLRDHGVLLEREWDVALLDEAQAVKNPAAATARRVRDIRCRMRVALTGTPMENSLGDLWTLFDWLIPGLLSDRKTFRARVAQPIEREGDARAQDWLNRRLRPFLLRRTKDEVVRDLPPKTEVTELVTLGPKQQALYEAMRVAMDRRVQDAIAARGIGGAHITILDALLKMRQTCCDPSLLPDAKPGVGSAKRERLLEMLDELVREGRRVLVFSQFVQMLHRIEEDVQDRGWRYEWLCGDTRDREGPVARFQAGKAPIFLISLKAGGVGLTLTAADAVILYDPWWNPAVERQAMDRAHRIGQERPVFVYRLVAEGTVEEAILRLQSRKQALVDALFEQRSARGLAFDDDTLAELFQPMPPDARDR